MIQVLTILLSVLLSYEAQAATLIWDAQAVVSPLTVERSEAQAGPFITIATLPSGTIGYILTPGAYGWYRVSNSAGPSNVVQFSLDLYTGLVTDRLTALETRVTALEAGPVVLPPPPAPTSNLTVRQIDADHIEITCNGIGITTTGSGTRRLMACRH